jgi:predicted RNA binding protein YcfA (HicA-like mRNA interferase family)
VKDTAWIRGEQARSRDCGDGTVKFSELVRLLDANGFALVKQKGSVRYYGKTGWPRLIRVDYHGPKEVRPGRVTQS